MAAVVVLLSAAAAHAFYYYSPGAAVVAKHAALASGAVVEVHRAAAWVKGAPSGGNRIGPWPIYCGR